MKIFTFLKLLNKKINKYDKLASNPFGSPQPITLVWVEDNVQHQHYKKRDDFL